MARNYDFHVSSVFLHWLRVLHFVALFSVGCFGLRRFGAYSFLFFSFSSHVCKDGHLLFLRWLSRKEKDIHLHFILPVVFSFFFSNSLGLTSQWGILSRVSGSFAWLAWRWD